MNPTHGSPTWQHSPLHTLLLTELLLFQARLPIAVHGLAPQMTPQGITQPLGAAPLPEAAPTLTAGSLLSGPGVSWLLSAAYHLITYRCLGIAWFPLQPVVAGRGNPISPSRGHASWDKALPERPGGSAWFCVVCWGLERAC